MKQALHPYQKAARVIRLMGWMGLLMSVGIGAAVLLPVISQGQSLPSFMFALLAFLVFVPVSLFVVARGIFAKREWARIAGMVYAGLALFGVPIGTVIGAYVLWQLSKGWPNEV